VIKIIEPQMPNGHCHGRGRKQTDRGEAMAAIAPMRLRLSGVLVFVLVMISGSNAGHALTAAEARAACTPDAFRLCAAQIPNVDAIIACLKREKAQLSPDCRAVFDAPQPASTTRSLVPTDDWCAFASNPDARDQIWRNWCGEAAR
jgi:hypothetical protein